MVERTGDQSCSRIMSPGVLRHWRCSTRRKRVRNGEGALLEASRTAHDRWELPVSRRLRLDVLSGQNPALTGSKAGEKLQGCIFLAAGNRFKMELKPGISAGSSVACRTSGRLPE
jgi:hypothetical protein